MRPRKKYLLNTIKEQKEIIDHLQKSVIELTAELIKIKRGKNESN